MSDSITEEKSTSKMSWEEYNGSNSQAYSYRVIVDVLSSSNKSLTGREICNRAGREGLWKRLTEMERLGWIIRKNKRCCTITGKIAYTWILK